MTSFAHQFSKYRECDSVILEAIWMIVEILIGMKVGLPVSGLSTIVGINAMHSTLPAAFLFKNI